MFKRDFGINDTVSIFSITECVLNNYGAQFVRQDKQEKHCYCVDISEF